MCFHLEWSLHRSQLDPGRVARDTPKSLTDDDTVIFILQLNELQLLYEEVWSFGPHGMTAITTNAKHFIDTIRNLLPLVRKRVTMLFNISGPAVAMLQTLLDNLPDEVKFVANYTSSALALGLYECG